MSTVQGAIRLGLGLSLANGGDPLGSVKSDARWYTIFNGSTSYVDLVTPWVASGDFEIRVSARLYSSLSERGFLFSDTSDSKDGIYWVGDLGRMSFEFNGAILNLFIVNTSIIDDDLFHVLTFKRVLGVLSIYIDDVFDVSGLISGAFTVNSIASPWLGATGIPYWSGVLYNVYLDTPSDIRFYPLDTSPDELPIYRDTLSEDGAELVTNGDFATGDYTGWDLISAVDSQISVNNGILTADGTGDNLIGVEQTLLTNPTAEYYKIQVDFNVVSGRGRIDLDGLDGLSDNNGNVSGGNIDAGGGWATYTLIGKYDTDALKVQVYGLIDDSIIQVGNVRVSTSSDALGVNIQESDLTQELP